jgi:hypothetical protein
MHFGEAGEGRIFSAFSGLGPVPVIPAQGCFPVSIQTLSILSAAAAGGQPPAWLQFLPLVLMGIVMWFLFLRPQMQQQKSHKSKLESIKKNDMVALPVAFWPRL